MISTKEKQRYEEAKLRVKKMTGFYTHLTVYIIINTYLIFFNGHNRSFTNGEIEFSRFYTAFFWGIGLFFHWLSVFGFNWLFNKKWEERKIQELIEKENQERTRWQ